jgi:hypothetical protein
MSGQLQSDMAKVAKLALPPLAFLAGGGWMADILKDLAFAEHADLNWLNYLFYALFFLLGAMFFFGGALATYRMRRRYLPVRMLGQANAPMPHKVLIAAISGDRTGVRVVEGKPVLSKPERSEQPIPLSGDIEEDTQRRDLKGFSWQQLLRALKPHRSGLVKVYLIGSKDEKGEGSHKDLDRCAEFLKCYLKENQHVVPWPEAVDFERIDDLYRLFCRILQDIDQIKVADQDIMIDVTGGQKTASIAAALVTLNRPLLQFQYVSTTEPFPVLAFNVVAETPVEIEG